MLPEIKISEMHKYIEFFLFPVLESSLNFHFSMFSYSMHKWIASWTLFRLDFPSNTLLFFSLKTIWFPVLSASWLVERLDFFWLEVRFFAIKQFMKLQNKKHLLFLLPADRTTSLVNFIVED